MAGGAFPAPFTATRLASRRSSTAIFGGSLFKTLQIFSFKSPILASSEFTVRLDFYMSRFGHFVLC